MNSVIETKPSTAPVVAALRTPTDLGNDARSEIALGLTAVLADTFTLLLKTKNFHWHVSGPHFRDYHLLLDDQADQILAMTDPIAERARKLGGTTLRSIGHIVSVRRLEDNEKDFVGAVDYVNAKHTRRELEQYAIDAHRGLSAVKCKDLRYRELRADSVAALQSAGHSRK